jgi:hypothetical protein
MVAGLTLAACGLALGGCNETTQKAAANAVAPGAQPQITAPLFPRDVKTVQSDATPEVQFLVQVIAYKITLPAGAVSRNPDFWKRVKENAVDVATYEMLYKNGMRVGVAASSEWDYLKGVLEQNPAMTQTSTFTGREVKDLETELKLKVPYQNLFYYDAAGELVGRTHERCDDLVRVSFQPTPRKPGTVRITLCPVVRSLRERIVPVGDVNTTTYQFTHPEQLYDLNLTADVPLDEFLVVAPSPEAKWPTSLGNNFLVEDGPTEQKETLLIFRPVPFAERVKAPGGAATATPPTPEGK